MVATPTLTVADQADGTGATATVADGDAESDHTIFTMAFDGALGTGTWTNSGDREGDGTVDLSLTAGHYFAYCLAEDDKDSPTESAISTVVYFVVTTGDESTHYQILVAVQAVIQSLTLAGLDNDSVVVKKLPLERAFDPETANPVVALPCVLITPVREIMPPTAGVTSFDDVLYGVLVTTVGKDNQEKTLAADIDTFTLWRQRIAMAFRSQGLSAVATVYNAVVEPADVVIPSAWHANLFASALLIRFTSRETRGLT